MEEAGIGVGFVQENHVFSRSRFVLRGLHFQVAPGAQAKLVRVSRGAIFDVAVDIRPGSATFGHWAGLLLSASLWNQLFIPEGFAHGYLTLEEGCEVQYRLTAPYRPELQRAIRFDDPDIDINWPAQHADLEMSDADRSAPSLAALDLR